ncbi:NADPH dehydrogenase NamA [Paenibacillus roseipurpureus]|uniref:NADPH dehydrogenase NamA n=1 Tax=Paenibacillus roseopurpureus TaxID=2918901 RepID=A0AA96LLM3_9BACL|nr:NADPH dehydrogenase NamA [Paenibacillus sp. MBLB1832]WNR43407.1 NADPH dehydrogenase NamA [Paenibacillus sp. MBLB1832]
MLFTPYTLAGLTLKNRIVMSPMCMYASDDSGEIKDWHHVHYATRAVGQVGLIILEATAVTARGRISARDLGIWDDTHIEGLKRVVDSLHGHGAHAGIQLAHAGRKSVLDTPSIAPSPIPFSDSFKTPEEATLTDIQDTIQAFADATERAKRAGFDVIEIHAAHGYLINEFLSPLSNHRQDAYGGDQEGRFRFLRETVEAIQTRWQGPLFVRISAHEYAEGGLTPEDHVYIATKLKELGVHLIDVSSGGNAPIVPTTFPGYQVPFAEEIRTKAHIPVGAVGLITEPQQAEEILQSDRADLIFLGRVLLRDPYWARTAARDLRVELAPPQPYQRGW